MTEQPYNSLGQILSTGGEIALGVALSLEKSPASIALLFARRFRLEQQSDRDALMNLALRGTAIGREVHLMSDEDLIDLSIIPVNSYLFADDPAGKRILTVSDVSGDGGETWVQKRIIWPDQPTWSELAESLAELLEDLLEKYPGEFGAITQKDRPPVELRHHFAERQF